MAQASNELKPRLCVIGAGPAGLAVAAAAAAFDMKPVLIEKGGLGRESLYRGSVPAQALIAAAARAQAARANARFGIKTGRMSIDPSVVTTQVRTTVDALAPNATRERFAGLGVTVIEASARFADPRTVVAGDFVVKASCFVIATGSSPAIPDIPGLAVTPYLTEATIFTLKEIPRHLIVIGAGAAGLELAQVFRRLGSKVTVIEPATPLAGIEPEAAAVVLHALAREGISLRIGAEVTKVGRALAKLRVTLRDEAGEETIEGTHLLLTSGRRPNIDDLDLDAAGIQTTAEGLVLDNSLRTANKRVYAVGDAAGGPHATHVGHYHASLAIRNGLFGAKLRVNYEAVPLVTYTDPELAQVGMLEGEARAHSGAIRVLRWPYRENDRAQIERTTEGHIKIVTDRAGEILGATIVGPRASESITPWTLAIGEKLNIRAFAGLVVPYPSYAEVGKRAAITFFNHGLTRPRTRRIMGWSRRTR